MAILYLDFLYPEGHKEQNSTYINILSTLDKVIVVCPQDFYKIDDSFLQCHSNIQYLLDKSVNYDSKYPYRVNIIRRMIYCSKIKKKNKFDCIIIASYDTVTFPIWQLLIKHDCPEYIIQHNNIDGLKNLIKHICFSLYAKKINHIVFEKFIVEYLRDKFNIDESRLIVLPHQCNRPEIKTATTDKIKYRCVGLSGSNDESFIKSLIDLQKKKNIIKNKYTIILKSSIYEYNDGKLCVYKNYLSDDDYNYLMYNCQIVCLPFSKTFKYRTSGSLNDAIANKKIIVGSNILLLQHYSKLMPQNCYIYDTVEDCIKLLDKDFCKDLNSFDNYISAHSTKKIKEIFNKFLLER